MSKHESVVLVAGSRSFIGSVVIRRLAAEYTLVGFIEEAKRTVAQKVNLPEGVSIQGDCTISPFSHKDLRLARKNAASS